MEKLWSLISDESLQYAIFLGISAAIFLLTGITYASNSAAFERFFGGINPILAVFIIFNVGLILFSLLLADGQFAVFRRGNGQGVLLALGLALPFAAAIILVDRQSPFAADTNVPIPDSLTFYPVMGYVAEILFIVLPFCLIYLSLRGVLGEVSNTTLLGASFLIVALIEPIFQILFTQGQDSAWAIGYMGLHVFLISLIQLLLFRRYDFITMYSFRLSYYCLWHIVWGHLRLNVLF